MCWLPLHGEESWHSWNATFCPCWWLNASLSVQLRTPDKVASCRPHRVKSRSSCRDGEGLGLRNQTYWCQFISCEKLTVNPSPLKREVVSGSFSYWACMSGASFDQRRFNCSLSGQDEDLFAWRFIPRVCGYTHAHSHKCMWGSKHIPVLARLMARL